MNLTTTLTEIFKQHMTKASFATLIFNITGNENFSNGKQHEKSIESQFNLLSYEEKNKEVSLLDILESNGIADAFWALQCWGFDDYCLLLADVTESVLHIWEKEYPDDDRPRKYIEGIRLFYDEKITAERLNKLYTSAKEARDRAFSLATDLSCSAYYASRSVASKNPYVVFCNASRAAEGKQCNKNEELMRKFIGEVGE